MAQKNMNKSGAKKIFGRYVRTCKKLLIECVLNDACMLYVCQTDGIIIDEIKYFNVGKKHC